MAGLRLSDTQQVKPTTAGSVRGKPRSSFSADTSSASALHTSPPSPPSPSCSRSSKSAKAGGEIAKYKTTN